MDLSHFYKIYDLSLSSKVATDEYLNSSSTAPLSSLISDRQNEI